MTAQRLQDGSEWLPDPYANTRPPRPRWKPMHAVITTFVIAIVSAIGGAALSQALDSDTPEAHAAAPVSAVQPVTRGALSPGEKHTTTLFKRSAPSVVYITKLKQRRRGALRLDATAMPAGTGSGFVWDKRGHIVTNYHVIRGGSGARVALSDGSTWNAKLVGHAVDKDLAVLHIDAPADKLAPIVVGTSDDLEVGQDVLAIGNPFGLDHTLSTGVISGLGREIKSVAGHPISGVVQTDAAINPGNSGGPLLDSAGRLIGVNTAIFSPSGASAGIGFAVPVDTVSRIVPELIAHGRLVKPGLGIEIADTSLARHLKARGVLVMSVLPGSGAEKAGILPMRREARTGRTLLGDVIVAVDGAPVRTPADLYRALDERRIGDQVTVEVRRGKRNEKLTIELVDISSKRQTQ